jgi:hypothetical protein
MMGLHAEKSRQNESFHFFSIIWTKPTETHSISQTGEVKANLFRQPSVEPAISWNRNAERIHCRQ